MMMQKPKENQSLSLSVENPDLTVLMTERDDLQLSDDETSVVNRIFQLENPVLYENMLPYLFEVCVC